jgi:hypothetical protein
MVDLDKLMRQGHVESFHLISNSALEAAFVFPKETVYGRNYLLRSRVSPPHGSCFGWMHHSS